MDIQNDKEVALELLTSLKEDTSKVSNLETNKLYSLQLDSGKEIIAETKFSELELKPELLQAIYSQDLEKPSLIQNLAIPLIRDGHSAVFQSKSGTGKTIAFVIGALQRTTPGTPQQVLIMSPTRELSNQVGKVVETLASSINLKVCFALGNYECDSIKEEIIVGCPGKILSLINSKILEPEKIKMIVFDEADELISNQTFSAQTMRLLRLMSNAQKVFFSATYSELSQKALTKLVPDAKKFLQKNEKADKIALYYLEVQKSQKISTLKSLFEFLTVAQTIVFVSTKHAADMVAQELKNDGFSVSIIHGNLTPEQRDSGFADFGQAKTKILVSTNLFSRGMDIPQVNLIINYDIPNFSSFDDQQTYIHRIGRSGRFNRAGFVIDFISSKEDLEVLGSIQSSMGSTSKKFTIKGLQEAFFELDSTS